MRIAKRKCRMCGTDLSAQLTEVVEPLHNKKAKRPRLPPHVSIQINAYSAKTETFNVKVNDASGQRTVRVGTNRETKSADFCRGKCTITGLRVLFDEIIEKES